MQRANSLTLGYIAGIKIHVHWTFAILVAWVLIVYLLEGHGWSGALMALLFISTIFACIVAHELAHALTARRFNIKTRDIILYPIGGVSRLERMPEQPRQEFLVAFAGPAMSFLIAAALYLVHVALTRDPFASEQLTFPGGNFLTRLMWINVALGIFNLLPAFPMDGGRVLRSFLAQQMDYRRATEIAAKVGKFFAVVLGILGLLFNPLLFFVAIFVFLGAQQEAYINTLRSALTDLHVRDGMLTNFEALSPADSINTAAQKLIAGSQTDFPVAHYSAVDGLVTRGDIIAALAEGKADHSIETIMHKGCPVLQEQDSLEHAWQKMRDAKCAALPVVRGTTLTGLLTFDNMMELIWIRSALKGEPQKGSIYSYSHPGE